MDIVINASPLILLSKINRLYLLNDIFNKIYVPTAVINEIQATNKADVGMRISDELISEVLKNFQ